jgi:hypothetical protein
MINTTLKKQNIEYSDIKLFNSYCEENYSAISENNENPDLNNPPRAIKLVFPNKAITVKFTIDLKEEEKLEKKKELKKILE